MNDEAQLEALLTKVEAIGVKYAGVAEREQYAFNVFSILRKPHEEVGLHSAFLKSLLDPQGGHGQGTWFLNRFLEKIEGIDPVDEKAVKVFCEYTRLRNTDDGNKRDSMDIYIRDGNRGIVIENKIYAEDQKGQIERYVKSAKKSGAKNIDVIYLTLDGSDPSGGSLGSYKNKDVVKMSYKHDVNNWLNECIEHMARYPTTRESLILYQRIVRRLTNQAMNERENMEIVNLLMKTPQAFETANKIVTAFDDAKAKIQFEFWEDLESELMGVDLRESAIMKEDEKGQKYTFDKIKEFYTKKRNRPWYGIKILLGNLNQQPDAQICFYVEVEWNIYYGFIVQKPDGKRIKSIVGIQEALEDNYEYDDGWPAWRYPQSDSGVCALEIDFKNFNERAVALIDAPQRKAYVKKLALEIKETIQENVGILKRDGLLINEEAIWANPST